VLLSQLICSAGGTSDGSTCLMRGSIHGTHCRTNFICMLGLSTVVIASSMRACKACF
jgi:hypothetical protein